MSFKDLTNVPGLFSETFKNCLLIFSHPPWTDWLFISGFFGFFFWSTVLAPLIENECEHVSGNWFICNKYLKRLIKSNFLTHRQTEWLLFSHVSGNYFFSWTEKMILEAWVSLVSQDIDIVWQRGFNVA